MIILYLATAFIFSAVILRTIAINGNPNHITLLGKRILFAALVVFGFGVSLLTTSLYLVTR